MKAPPILVLLAGLLAGCQSRQAATPEERNAAVTFDPEGVKIMPPTPGQRFTPTSSPLVSFDTQTGQLCKTYSWGPSYGYPKIIDDCYSIVREHPAQSASR